MQNLGVQNDAAGNASDFGFSHDVCHLAVSKCNVKFLRKGYIMQKLTHRLLDGMPYTPAAKTDVTKTWTKYGWVPPSKLKEESCEQAPSVLLYSPSVVAFSTTKKRKHR